jgi:hypothetical protein
MPWDQVWVGHSAIVGEVREGDVVVRILLSYSEIGISAVPEHQTYHCGQFDAAPVTAVAKRMRNLAKQAAALNQKIAKKDYPWKTALIAISPGGNSSFRIADNKGLAILKKEDNWEKALAHEASHGIFGFHMGEGIVGGAPDVFAQQVAELFVQLQGTTEVSRPTGLFDPANPPPLTDNGETTTKPAGLIMVDDILWSGTEGHPWDNADEFFASAHGAFQDRKLFNKIVAHYGKADKKIPPLAKKLATLLGKVGKPKELAKLKAPKDRTAIDPELGRISPKDYNPGADPVLNFVVDPSTLPGPPSPPACPANKPSGVQSPATGAQPEGAK